MTDYLDEDNAVAAFWYERIHGTPGTLDVRNLNAVPGILSCFKDWATQGASDAHGMEASAFEHWFSTLLQRAWTEPVRVACILKEFYEQARAKSHPKREWFVQEDPEMPSVLDGWQAICAQDADGTVTVVAYCRPFDAPMLAAAPDLYRAADFALGYLTDSAPRGVSSAPAKQILGTALADARGDSSA